MRLVLVVFLLMTTAKIMSQDRVITGTVTNSTKQPLQGVSVTLMLNDSSKIIAFAITGRDGSFRIGPLSSAIEKYVLEFRHIGFDVKKISSDKLKDPWQDQYRIELTEKPTDLREIVVRRELPVLVRSDTVVFNANSYRDPEVRKVEDLLKKMQGFSVDASGKLSFNGKPVEKVLIDGDDLAGDGYRMITKNLNAITIDKVEVINNYSDNRLLKKVRETDKVGVNLKISSGFRSKLSGSAEAGLALEGRYNADINLIHLGKCAKWLVFGNYNNIARDVSGNAKYYYQQEGGDLVSGNGTPAGAAVLENGSLVMPALGDRYTRDNKDLGIAVMNSWKIGRYSRFNSMIGYDDLRQHNYASYSMFTRINELEQWQISNDLFADTKSRDLVGRFSFHRDAGKKQVSRVDLVVNAGRQGNIFSSSSTGDITDSLKEKLKNDINAIRLKGQQTWLAGSRVVQLSLIIDYGRIDQELGISSSRFLSYWNLDSTYTLNRQLIEKMTDRQQLELKVNGKTARVQYEYGVVTEFLKTTFGSESIIKSTVNAPAIEPGSQGTAIRDASGKGMVRLVYDAGRSGWFGLTATSGLESLTDLGKRCDLFVYETGLGYSRKFGIMNSVRINYKLSRGFRRFDQVYPDQIMSGNATVLNGLKFSEPELTHGIVGAINYNNLVKQRTWSANLSFVNFPQRYINGVEAYPQYALQYFEMSRFSYMLNLGINGEIYVTWLRSKLGGLFSFYSGKDENSVNGVRGRSDRQSFKWENWLTTGFRMPVNLELRCGAYYSEGSWNSGQPNSIWQYYWTSKLKLRAGPSLYGSVLWNGQKVTGQKAFHGIDVYTSYKLNAAMQVFLTGVNLLNVGRVVDVAVMPYSRSENGYRLVGRYVMASFNWSF